MKNEKQDYEMRQFCDVFDFDLVGTNQSHLNSNGLWDAGGAVEEWRHELKKFGFADVGRGIVPAAVQKLLETCGVRKKMARSTVLAAWKEAGIGVKEMWKQRCEITVAWEEEHGIRQAAKEGKGKDKTVKTTQQGVIGGGRSGQEHTHKHPPPKHQPTRRHKQ